MSDTISGAALAISIIALIVSWLAYQRDMGKLSLRFEASLEPSNPNLVLYITNVGRRPVTIRSVNFFEGNRRVRWGKKHLFVGVVHADRNGKRVITQSTKLEEGQETDCPLSWLILFDFVEVTETTGRVYRLSLDKNIKLKLKAIDDERTAKHSV